MRILWAGPLQPEKSLLSGTAPHPATMRWQDTYLSALAALGHDIVWVGHDPHRVWPWGPLMISGGSVANEMKTRGVPYVNAPLLRRAHLSLQYQRMVNQAISDSVPDVFVTYNIEDWATGMVRAVKRRGVPWIPLILDALDPRPDGWKGFLQATNGAAGVGFVSKWAYEHAPVKEKHLIRSVVPVVTQGAAVGVSDTPVVMYAGSHSRDAGADRFVLASGLVRTVGVRFMMTGHGRRLNDQITGTSLNGRVFTDLGVIAGDKLIRVMQQARVLVNPRPVRSGYSHMTFPSKLLEYLAHGAPIVSTKAPGIPPCFDDLLVYATSDSPADLAKAIDVVLAWSEAERTAWRERAKRFRESHAPRQAAEELGAWFSLVTGDRSA